jgi:hypothetical protein
MTRPRKDWDARLLGNAHRTAVRHRRGRAVSGLTAVTVLLAVVGLIADIRFGSWRLGYVCYAAALVSGIILLAFLFSRRLRVTRYPDR